MSDLKTSLRQARAVLSAEFALKQRCERIAWEEEVLKPELERIAFEAVGSLEIPQFTFTDNDPEE